MSQSAKMLTAFVGALVLACPSYLRAEDTSGTIASVDAGKNEVTLKGTLSNSVYDLNKSTAVWLDGAKAKLSDLRTDDRAVITYEKANGRMVASVVRGLRNTQETNGTVRDIYGDKREITLKGTLRDTTYELGKDGAVWLNGSPSKLTDIHSGDEVRINYSQRGDRYVATSISATRK